MKLAPTLDADVIDFDPFLHDRNAGVRECKTLAEALARDGLCWVMSTQMVPPAIAHLNSAKDLLMELARFDPNRLRSMSDPQNAYQTGFTPENQERPQPLDKRWTALLNKTGDHPTPTTKTDGKFRWMHPYSPYAASQYSLTDTGILGFNTAMETYAQFIFRVAYVAGEMMALGNGLEHDALTKFWRTATHFWAPTITPMKSFRPYQCTTAAHVDLNGITVHGPSTPGGILHLWKSDGTKYRLGERPNEHCILIQVGMGWQHRFGGMLTAGLHEVLADENTDPKKIRLGCPTFIEGRRDMELAVFKPWRTTETLARFPDTTFGEHMLAVLKAIGLAA